MKIIAWIVSGILAGWLTGRTIKGHGYGLSGNLLIGSVGGLLGAWVLERVLHLTPEGGWGGQVVVAMLGGVILVGGVRILDQATRTARQLTGGPVPDPATGELEHAIQRLGSLEKRILAHMVRRTPVTTDANAEFERQTTFGERVADQVASFGGSWTFIGLFLGMMAVWMTINIREAKPFDPYPFILLNLVLSCLAALQAPVIMMSQNRQADRDRVDAQNDYRVNLNAEMQILSLHSKFDELREQQWAALVELQQRQIALLEQMAAGDRKSPGA
jgi:uncharacterized membrane protein/uncharacterized membrane protein YeaQ/YmgE (transglycosylase-associated protein family)